MRSIADAIFGLYRGTPQHGEWVVGCLNGAWPALVGDRLAGICRPCKFEGACLTVEVTDASWSEALKSMETDIRDKLRVATGLEIQRISFRSVTD